MAEIRKWIDKIDNVSEGFKSLCQGMDSNDLNKRNSESDWSIAQIMEHLILTNTSYFPIFQKLKEGAYQPSFLSRIKWWPSFMGSFILKSVQPSRAKKIKTFPIWTPSQKDLSSDILDRFLNHQELLKVEISQLDLYIEKAVIHSPANRHILYSLQTALDIITTHEERHLLQAKSKLA